MKCLLSLFFLLLTLPAMAQERLPLVQAALHIGPERQFFELGVTLARGAFAYAALAKQASAVAKTHDKLAQVRQLDRLDPLAGRCRADARSEMGRAEMLMRQLHAPLSALTPVAAAAARLAGPLPTASDARTLVLFSRPAARTVSSLAEFETLSSLPDSPAIRRWLEPAPASAQIWYREGVIAGLAQIAAAQEMPDLLPPAAQIASDLRGLRDWLAGRVPELSAEQAALKHDLNALLEQASFAVGSGVKSRTLLSASQLQALGSISRRVQAQVLGTGGAEMAAQSQVN